MSGLQLYQIKDYLARNKFGSVAGEEMDNLLALLHDKLDKPLDINLAGAILTVEAATKQKIESDGSDGTQNSYRWRLPPLGGVDVDPDESTFNFSTGAITGDFASHVNVPSMTAGWFIQMGIELRDDGKFHTVWGDEAASAGATSFPRFNDDAAGILRVILQDDGTGGQWNFITPGRSSLDLMGSVGGGGGGGGAAQAFKIKALAGATAFIKKSYLPLDDRRVLVTGSPTASTDLVDLEIDLSTILASPDDASFYGLFVDMSTLDDPVYLSDNQKRVIYVPDETAFVLKKDTYEMNPARYIFLGGFVTPGSGNTWVGSTFFSASIALHTQLGGFYPYAEVHKDESITSEVADSTIVHSSLDGQPDVVEVWYYDDSAPIGQKEKPLSATTHVLYSNETETHIDSTGLPFDAGDKLIVRCFRFSRQSNGLISATRSFKSDWYQDTSTTEVLHSLGDKFEIVGLVLQEWDLTTDKMKNLDPREVVVNWDDEKIYLDWTGKTPSANLQYRIVSGPTQLPFSRPIKGNEFIFTATGQLTSGSTSYQCTKIYGDLPIRITAIQKLTGKGWAPVDNIGGMVWVTDDGNLYLQGDIDALSPSASEPVKIIVE